MYSKDSVKLGLIKLNLFVVIKKIYIFVQDYFDTTKIVQKKMQFKGT